MVIALAGFEEKFWIGNRITSQGLPYDFSSIMHVPHDAFSRDSLKSTVVPRNRTIQDQATLHVYTYIDRTKVEITSCYIVYSLLAPGHTVSSISHRY